MVDDFAREYAEFNSALMRESYLFHSGLKSELAVAPIYERYSDLYGLDSITRLKHALEKTPEHFETERASLRRLLTFAIDQFLAASVKELTEAISHYESKATIEWLGREMTFQESSVALNTERDRKSRRDVYNLRAAVIEESNDLRAARTGKLHEAARRIAYAGVLTSVGCNHIESLLPSTHGLLSQTQTAGPGHGFSKGAPPALVFTTNGSRAPEKESYRALYQELMGLDYASLQREAEQLLERTESVYLAKLDAALRREMGIGTNEAERHDALHFLNMTRYDDRFPPDDLLTIYAETMAGLGIRVEAQTNIEVDSEPRPQKTPRAFCAPIVVPEEIKLVIRPIGGQSDYLTFLHEAGHAQHYGWTSASLRPEFKYTGDYALSETYAFLLNHLPCEDAWLAGFLGVRNSSELVGSTMLARLVTVRRYAAKFMYECELHDSGGLSGARSLYSELQTSATKFRTGETEFLFDLDDSFYSASYLRAWAFEVILREYLKTRFGKDWWASRRAGSFLKEIWETGDRYTADEMAGQIGAGPISFEPLTKELISRV